MQTNKDTITSVAQDAKQGIPHVEGRKSKTPGKPLVAAAMLALCVLVGYNLYQNQDAKEQKTETSKAKENGNIYTSNKTLVLDHQASVKKEEIKVPLNQQSRQSLRQFLRLLTSPRFRPTQHPCPQSLKMIEKNPKSLH